MNKTLLLPFTLLVIFLFNIPQKAVAQIIQGKVTDSETNLPIEFANIVIKGAYIGTITNADGEFYLNTNGQYDKKTLVISFIGYETKEYSIDNSYINVKLAPVSTYIDELIIRPDSTLFTLLKKAYKRILDNYPSESTILQGFYRESLLDSTKEYLYIVEAIINSYKTSYKNKQSGQVEIVKSRKNVLPGMDSINNIKFYGGPFVAHSSDIVHERDRMIKPRFFKDYNYSFIGIIPYGPYELYKISFESKATDANSKLQGFFYLESKTLGYVYFEYEKTGSWVKDNSALQYSYASGKVLYQEINNKWMLKSRIGEQRAYNQKTQNHLILKTEYVTNSVSGGDVLPIPFDKQVQFGDIFTHVATNYEESYWKDYNTIKSDTLKVNTLVKQLTHIAAKMS